MLEDVPGLMTDIPFSFSFFSTLKGHSSISSHFGPTNLRLRLHIPLFVPSNATSDSCALVLAREKKTWSKTLVFDDSYEHETFNYTDEDRVVLLLDIWHPDIHVEERAAIIEMFKKVK